MARFATAVEDLLAFERQVGVLAQRLHARVNITALRRFQVAARMLVGHQGIQGVVAIEDGIDERIDGVAADIGCLEKAFGAGDQQILRQDLVALEQQPGFEHDAMKLQEGAVAEGERAEEAEVDQRGLQGEVIELAENIAEF